MPEQQGRMNPEVKALWIAWLRANPNDSRFTFAQIADVIEYFL